MGNQNILTLLRASSYRSLRIFTLIGNLLFKGTMLIEKYEDKKHYDSLNSCILKRNLPQSYAKSERPEVGYLVMDNDSIICAGFFLKIEGSTMMIDGYITNPDYSPEIRHTALDLLTQHMVKSAKELNAKRLIAITNEQNILDRAIKHGFKHLKDYQIIGREI